MRCTSNLLVTLVVPCLAVLASAAALPAQAAQAAQAASTASTATADQLPTPAADCPGTPGGAAPKTTPWAQQALSFSSVWGQTEGAGVTVAVIDSGVDANPQFGNRVTVGPDLSTGAFDIATGADCVGHGTAVASIIAAAPMAGNKFSGVAPRASILSIKITNAETGIPNATIVTAIRDAVEAGASVINLSLATANTPALRSAVQFAEDSDVVVVAAAGNDNNPGVSPGVVYPAAYPGVISVGEVAKDGSLGSLSDTDTPVTVTAPGVDVTGAYPGTYPHAYSDDNGTSFATAFVSGVAALVRAAYPNLTAAQVTDRIKETADGAAGPGTGNGLVNPVQAVTAVLPENQAAPDTAGRRVPVARAVPADTRPRTIALSIAAAALAAGLLVIAAVLVIPAARRRRRHRPHPDTT